jgi:hypothetical protein
MRLLTIISIATALTLVACKPPTPSYSVTDPKTGEKTKISVDPASGKNTVTIDSPEGKGSISVSSEGEAPKNLPSYVPNYPGAKYEGSFVADVGMSGKDGPAKGGMVAFKTTDSADKVLEFYKAAFTRAGMKEGATGDMGGMKMTAFTKGEGDKEGAQVMATPAPEGGTQVQVMYSVAQ